MSKYIYWVKKRLVFGCFRIEEIRDKDNETGLKEGGFIENVNLQCFSIYAIARFLSLLNLLTCFKSTAHNQPLEYHNQQTQQATHHQLHYRHGHYKQPRSSFAKWTIHPIKNVQRRRCKPSQQSMVQQVTKHFKRQTSTCKIKRKKVDIIKQ